MGKSKVVDKLKVAVGFSVTSNILTITIPDDALFTEIDEIAGLLKFERGNNPHFIILNTYQEYLELKLDVSHLEHLRDVLETACDYELLHPILSYSHIEIILGVMPN